jgi:hypothetical protein
MENPLSTSLTTLYESYERNPLIKSLIHLLGVSGVPIGSLVDTSLAVYVNKLKSNRLKCFFDELDSGKIALTDDIIEQNDFLSAYFSIVNYVIRTRSDEKIRCFARILKNYNLGSFNINDFDDYTSIFNELSEREFFILVIKYHYEIKNKVNANKLNPAQLTNTYWDNFKNEVCSKIGLPENELDPLLIRLQRTGCYIKHTGYWDDGPNAKGDTTDLFKKIYELIYS